LLLALLGSIFIKLCLRNDTADEKIRILAPNLERDTCKNRIIIVRSHENQEMQGAGAFLIAVNSYYFT